jgi:hypothetical protein
MAGDAITVEALGRRVSELEHQVVLLQLLLESNGATRTGDKHRRGEYEVRRGVAASSMP